MKKIILLFMLFSISSCKCGNSFYSFTKNYERNVSVSKDLINNNIGKAIKLSETFVADIEVDVLPKYGEEFSSYRLDRMSLYYFWLRLISPSDKTFDFMETVTARIRFGDVDASISDLTVPSGDDSFKLLETYKNEFTNGESEIGNFTINLSFVPKEAVSEDIVLQWDFTFSYQVELE